MAGWSVHLFLCTMAIFIGWTKTGQTAKPTEDDLLVQYMGTNFSMKELLHQVNLTGNFSFHNLCTNKLHSCETRGCADTSWKSRSVERKLKRPCYCDHRCPFLGDCCYDYYSRCAQDGSAVGKNESKCINTENVGNHGYVMINSCPPHYSDAEITQLCSAQNSTDMLKMLPVMDEMTNLTYKNVFCATCNSDANFSYWLFSAECDMYVRKTLPTDAAKLMEFVRNNCSWRYTPKPTQKPHLQYCLSIERECTAMKLVEEFPSLSRLCYFYALPFCDMPSLKNPHCVVCRGGSIGDMSCRCDMHPLSKAVSVSPPSLNILFDFTSQTVNVGKSKTAVHYEDCKDGFIYDPFVNECRRAFKKPSFLNGNTAFATNKSCTFIKLNSSKATVFVNGTLWVESHGKTYSKKHYFVNGSSIFICTNFTKQYPKESELAFSSPVTTLQILTYTGGAISIVSLMVLLITYMKLQELRTLPGKNLMNLACALLLYHLCYFLTGQVGIQRACATIAVSLHYCFLASFAWMGVLAFDMTRTFATKAGRNVRSRETAGQKRSLMKYCLFAWGIPALVVGTSATLDATGALYIGYGNKTICWISDRVALLLLLGVPVGLILLFNLASLTLTMVAIYRVKKITRTITDQSNQSDLAFLYIKLTAVLGLPWVFCFVDSFIKKEFISFACVTFNSLQGFFLCLVFVANKRTLNLLKGLKKKKKKHTSSVTTTTTTTTTTRL